jgi:hypothetical protein
LRRGRWPSASEADESCRIAYLTHCDAIDVEIKYKAVFIGTKHSAKWIKADIIDPYLIFQFHSFHVSER